MTPQFKSLLTRTLSGIVFVALVVGSFFLPSYCQFILFTVFAAIALSEYMKITESSGVKIQKIMCAMIVVLVIEGGYLSNTTEISWLIAIFFMLLVPVVELFKKESVMPFTNIAHTYLPVFWIAVPFALAGVTFSIIDSPELILALFILIWASDTFAYCAGSLFGKHKLFERISPKKTWEGSIISAVLTCGLAVGLSYIPYFAKGLLLPTTLGNVLVWIGFALIVVVAGTFGDLIESMFKRSYGVKDSGNIMPGHGGMLDRFDSFFLAMPFCMIYWVLITFIVH
jgi:phosphatidate cytidylyltransferase